MDYAERVEYFHHDGLRLGFRQAGEKLGNPVLLIHGFSSDSFTNWVSTGWFDVLLKAGHRVIAIDNRGHGYSDKIYEPSAYAPERMAADSRALLAHLKLPKAHIMGYSMGARLSVYLALHTPQCVQSAVFGGLGLGMITGQGDWETVRDALLAGDIADVHDAAALRFREFVDKRKSDKRAMAACIVNFKRHLTEAQIKQIQTPALVADGGEDELSGPPQPLADLLPRGEALVIPGRDHLKTVGDLVYKRGALDFFAKNNF